MGGICSLREKIYDHFHTSVRCKDHFINSNNDDEYAKYYTSMYLLQDSTEGLWKHRESGFSEDPLIVYIEIWGILQAVNIQQDSIKALYEIFVGKWVCPKETTAWAKLRNIRITCGGHPVESKKQNTRSFMGRSFGGYDMLSVQIIELESGHETTLKIELGKIIDNYSNEAKIYLEEVLKTMKDRW